MNKSYDVYMCRNRPDFAISELDELIKMERYSEASLLMNSISLMDESWKSSFLSLYSKVPSSSVLKISLVSNWILYALNKKGGIKPPH